MIYNDEYLAHYGVKGMRWGVRNFQDSNGHLTREGRARYKAFKSEIKAENAKAKRNTKIANQELGWTYTHAKSTARSERRLKEVERKDPYLKNKTSMRIAEKALTKRLELDRRNRYNLRNFDLMKQHTESLIKKYGAEHVSAFRPSELKNFKKTNSLDLERARNQIKDAEEYRKKIIAGKEKVMKELEKAGIGPIVTANIKEK